METSKTLEYFDKQLIKISNEIEEQEELIKVMLRDKADIVKAIKKASQKMQTGLLYIVKEENTQNYKIGITNRTIQKRIRELNTGNSNNIVLVHSVKSTSYKKLERELHTRYEANQIKQEWFYFTAEEIKEVISYVQ